MNGFITFKSSLYTLLRQSSNRFGSVADSLTPWTQCCRCSILAERYEKGTYLRILRRGFYLVHEDTEIKEIGRDEGKNCRRDVETQANIQAEVS